MKKIIPFIAFLLIFPCPLAMGGQTLNMGGQSLNMGGKIYKWIDENGVKHFTVEPPPEGATLIETNPEIRPDEGAKDQTKTRKHAKSRAMATKTLEVPENEDIESLAQIAENIGFRLFAGAKLLTQEMSDKGMTDEEITRIFSDKERSNEIQQKARCKVKEDMMQDISKAEAIFLKHPEWAAVKIFSNITYAYIIIFKR